VVLLAVVLQAELDVPEVLGRENVFMKRLQRQAADAFSVLDTAQANMVSEDSCRLVGRLRTAGVLGEGVRR
jgi:hypothetical protein